ncbi:uncharacterized protein MONBRDRAFT_35579 [Monosiga brevicollis MX1]|uniref:GST N-terminal domain-containing protein n=1 Tax=Monosiga brevicollis TaxID=81824 RepID=A9UQ17_MONBE|nr:uncharacterized protein MONBRDRAFT_35579 [Monosiga brevicollis MX1]EDQ92518.1 predicted protein [Monosiga brevicollis MX1]|eukprot:XP_001742280.1 hypothetical protein [Monosiga brevicollis MX1]
MTCAWVIPLMALAGMAMRFALLFKAKKRTPILHTITFSHFVERVRWTMQRLNFEYKEQPDVGVFGLLMQARTVPRLELPAAQTVIGDSSAIMDYLWAQAQASPETAERAAFLRPTPEILELEKEMCEVLGNQSRRWLYQHIFDHPQILLGLWGIKDKRIPTWQRMLLPYIYPLLRSAAWPVVLSRSSLDVTCRPCLTRWVANLSESVRSMLNISPRSAERVMERVEAMFAKLDEQLEKSGGPFLFGKELTRADITLASLAATVICPDVNYTGNVAIADCLQFDIMPDVVQRQVLKLRATKAGALVQRLYRDERIPTA